MLFDRVKEYFEFIISVSFSVILFFYYPLSSVVFLLFYSLYRNSFYLLFFCHFERTFRNTGLQPGVGHSTYLRSRGQCLLDPPFFGR
jgi:hypothetical protein